jgi:uncharacterized protein (UPF0335 family)
MARKRDDFDPMAIRDSKMLAAGDDTEVEVTITSSGSDEVIHTTMADISAAANRKRTASKTNGVAKDQLRSFVERIERLEEERKTVGDDIKDVYGEAKGVGFIPKIIKRVIALRKMDEHARMEEDAILDTYLHALGMIEAPPEDD